MPKKPEPPPPQFAGATLPWHVAGATLPLQPLPPKCRPPKLAESPEPATAIIITIVYIDSLPSDFSEKHNPRKIEKRNSVE